MLQPVRRAYELAAPAVANARAAGDLWCLMADPPSANYSPYR